MDFSEFKEILEKHPNWSRLHKESVFRLLLVENGIKRNCTIENVQIDYLDFFQEVIDFLGLKSIFSEKTGIPKIIIGNEREEVDEIHQLEERIFIDKRDNEKEIFRYGVLMGYPSCCCKKSSKGLRNYDQNLKNTPGYHYYCQNPWPWQLSYIEPLVYHIPCSPNCAESIKIGEDISNARKSFFPEFDTSYPPKVHPSYVLDFSENLRVCFRGQEDESGSIKVTRILVKKLFPHIENTTLSQNLKKEIYFAKKIGKNGTLTIKEDQIIFRNNSNIKQEKIKYERKDKSRGLLVRFVI